MTFIIVCSALEVRKGQVHLHINFYSQDVKQDLKAELPPLNHQEQIPPGIFSQG